MENNGEIRTSAKPNKLYVIRKVMMGAIQKVLFIELPKVVGFLSNFGIFL